MGRTSDTAAVVRQGAHAQPVLHCPPGSSHLGRRRLVLGGRGAPAPVWLCCNDPGCGWDKGRGSGIEPRPGVAPDVASNAACNIAYGVACGVVSSVASDVASGAVSDVASGVISGVASGIVSRVVSCVVSCANIATSELRASTVHVCCRDNDEGAGVEPRLSRWTALLGSELFVPVAGAASTSSRPEAPPSSVA